VNNYSFLFLAMAFKPLKFILGQQVTSEKTRNSEKERFLTQGPEAVSSHDNMNMPARAPV
jgi:hypothetical protein